MEEMVCTLVTGDHHVYTGSLHVNYEPILYGIFQRPSNSSLGVHYRLFAARLEGVDIGLYSGVSIKTGDISMRPVAFDVVFQRVPESHGRLYEEMKKLSLDPWKAPPLEGNLVLDYVSVTPPRNKSDPSWERVTYIKDFPLIEALVTPDDDDGIISLPEPLRTIDIPILTKAQARYELPVFMQSERAKRPALQPTYDHHRDDQEPEREAHSVDRAADI